jgi:hypothetical protein
MRQGCYGTVSCLVDGQATRCPPDKEALMKALAHGQRHTLYIAVGPVSIVLGDLSRTRAIPS